MGFYDAGIARFLQEDSFHGWKGDPLSLNLYTYGHNNPIRYWDPTGHVVSEYDKMFLTPSQQAAIQKATDDWNKANAAGDKAGMAAAHAAAEAIRATGGYSGGSNGSNYIPNTQSNAPTPPSGAGGVQLSVGPNGNLGSSVSQLYYVNGNNTSNYSLLHFPNSYYVKIGDVEKILGQPLVFTQRKVTSAIASHLENTELWTVIGGVDVFLGYENLLYSSFGYINFSTILGSSWGQDYVYGEFADRTVMVGRIQESQRNDSIQAWQADNYLLYNVNMIIWGNNQNDPHALYNNKSYADICVEAFTGFSGVTPNVNGKDHFTKVNVTLHDSSKFSVTDINNLTLGTATKNYVVFFTDDRDGGRDPGLWWSPYGGINSGGAAKNWAWGLGNSHFIDAHPYDPNFLNNSGWYLGALAHESMHAFGVADVPSGIPAGFVGPNDTMASWWNGVNISNLHIRMMQEAIATNVYQEWDKNQALWLAFLTANPNNGVIEATYRK